MHANAPIVMFQKSTIICPRGFWLDVRITHSTILVTWVTCALNTILSEQVSVTNTEKV